MIFRTNTAKVFATVFGTLAVCMLVTILIAFAVKPETEHKKKAEPYNPYVTICIGGYQFADYEHNYYHAPPNQILNSEGKGIPCDQ